MADYYIFEAIAAERLALADLLDSLTPEQLATPSLCEGWTVHHAAAHLTFLWEVPGPTLVLRALRHRGSFAAAVDDLTRQLSRQPIERITGGLRSNATNRKHPPRLPAAPLTDLIVHGEDIRRPLGLQHRVPNAAVRCALDFVVSGRDRGMFLPRNRLGGLRLVATDLDWAWGEGAQISGPGLPLLLAVMGRPAALPQVHGATNVLTARIGAKQ